jgi:hypothetical protein
MQLLFHRPSEHGIQRRNLNSKCSGFPSCTLVSFVVDAFHSHSGNRRLDSHSRHPQSCYSVQIQAIENSP